MRKSLFPRCISGFLIFSYSLTALGNDSRQMRDIRPLTQAQSITIQSVKDFGPFYSDLKGVYDKKGPKAFVDKLSFIDDKIGREEVLKTLAKLPPLPSLKECGETCISFELDGKLVKVGVGNLIAGQYSINDENFRINFAKDSFHSKVEEIRNHLAKTLTKSDVKGNILTDAINEVCRIFVPEAHAAWSATTTAIVIGIVAIAAAVVLFFVGKHLIDKAKRKADNIVREAEKGAKKRIDEAAKHGEESINEAADAGVEAVQDAQESESESTDTVTTEDVDSEGYAADTDPVISDDGGRGEVRTD